MMTALLLRLPFIGDRLREREARDAYERLVTENIAARVAGFHFPPLD